MVPFALSVVGYVLGISGNEAWKDTVRKRSGHMLTSFLKALQENTHKYTQQKVIRWLTLCNAFLWTQICHCHEIINHFWGQRCDMMIVIIQREEFTSSMVKKLSMKTLRTTEKSHLSSSLESGVLSDWEKIFTTFFGTTSLKCDAITNFWCFIFHSCLLSSPRLNLRRLPISLPFQVIIDMFMTLLLFHLPKLQFFAAPCLVSVHWQKFYLPSGFKIILKRCWRNLSAFLAVYFKSRFE